MKHHAILLLSALYALPVLANSEPEMMSMPIDIAGPVAVFEPPAGWRYALGLGIESEPEYHGSGETVTEADPYIEVAYRSQRWAFQSNLMSNAVFYQLQPDLVLRGWLNFEEGREQNEASDTSLDGLGDIDEMMEWGAGAAWQIHGSLTLGVFAQTYTGGDPKKGSVGFVTVHYRIVNESDLKLELGADISFANGDHMQTEFGITAAQARESIYSSYQLGGGLKSYGISANGVYAFNKSWLLSFAVDYEVYASKVADSPLVRAGSDNEVEASLGLIYRF
ncbi:MULTISPECIES: MipA/OmpV family protein [Pseudoalteromonas]|uniref:MipA/OmpV family protein n=1 Tax=Pseudoalteromonas rubra TaxID=43658 RepID=A0A5S3UV03_9GAMM|nr:MULTISPECIES: MipA/OmpV family protein [Pseudoalteromonas]MCG7563727.1 MipA/OmpV family protein [Pseudoalteromonas sp. McH1-42]QPB82370.1 hypothetical protein CWC22_004965 [Pseudoalteromonas rubra]